jgi:hypothetical protein
MFIQEMELHSFGGQQHSSDISKKNVHWHIASKDQDSGVVVSRSFKGTGRRAVPFLSPLPLYCSHILDAYK